MDLLNPPSRYRVLVSEAGSVVALHRKVIRMNGYKVFYDRRSWLRCSRALHRGVICQSIRFW